MQKLGQHFLKNLAVTEKIIAALELAPNDAIIEIGAGHGEPTFPLSKACAKIGCTIKAIETDEALAKDLEYRIQNVGKNTEVIHADIRDYLKSFPKSYILNSKSSYKLVGNIPYYLTGYLLRLIGELPTKPERVALMIQQEVAERIAALPPEMNRLAASVQFWANPRIIAMIPKKDFDPPPKIDSAVVLLAPHKPQISQEDTVKYYKMVRALFSQPRKTILNNLQASCSLQKEKISSAIHACGIDPAARPQDLSILKITTLAQKLF